MTLNSYVARTSSYQKLWYTYYFDMYGYLADDETSGEIPYQNVQTKESVDSGSFTPGQYKVNPYKHSSLKVNPKACKFKLEGEYVSRNNWYSWVAGAEGAIGINVLNYYKASLSLITPDFGSLPNRALLRAEGKVGQAQQAMGEDLGELKETILMLRDPFGNFRRFLFDRNFYHLGVFQKLHHFLKTGRWGRLSGKRAADAAASTWMEFRYGFMPLVRSIEGVIELVNTGLKKFDPNKIYNAKSRLMESDGPTTITNGTDAAGYCFFTSETTIKKAYSCNASVQYRTTDTSNSLLDALGLTPRHLPELVYALKTLSFVVEWWLEIGPWLSALRINPGTEVLGNTVGFKFDVSAKVNMTSAIYGGYVEPREMDLGSVTSISYERVVNYPSPSLPQFTEINPLDLFRAIDSVSIIYQRISSAMFRGKKK